MRRICLLFTVFVLVVGLAACGDAPAQSSGHDDFTADDYICGSGSSSVLKIYIEVLKDNTTFYGKPGHIFAGHESEPGGEHLMLNEYLDRFSDDDLTFAVAQFAIIPVYGSDTPAVVLKVRPPHPGLRTILHYRGGVVYGYHAPFRGMRSIKVDGTFDWSGGADFSGTARLSLSPEFIYAEITSLSDMIRTDDGSVPSIFGTFEPVYYIHGEVVSRDEFRAFWEAHHQKEDAQWHTFSPETIAEDFAAAWDAFFARR